MRTSRICQALVGLLCLGAAYAQTNTAPQLPFEGPDGPGPERIGLNSFGGNALVVPGLHSEQFPLPVGEILLPPHLQIPRRYIVLRYYAVRPWFIHPYTGATLQPTDIISSIQSDNPDWQEMAKGRPLEELLEPEPDGEPLVAIEDGGLVDESNTEEMEAFAAEATVEKDSAKALNVDLGSPATGIVHAPFYGLYCLKIRICVPILTRTPGQVYQYWVRWPYVVHQRWCWHQWWWYHWRNIGGVWRIWPHRPLCIPHAYWSRVGPDWIWNVTNPNRFRHWCLYAHRYYFTPFGNPAAITPLPYVSQLNLSLIPPSPWIHVWPYPRVRYWPYRPYCARWYWYRCVPWFTYRYLPPIIQTAFAIPKDVPYDPENGLGGGGFVGAPDDSETSPSFPMDPPKIGADDMFERGGQSFFDTYFDIAGACTIRPLVKPLGDANGDGLVSSSDFARATRAESGHSAPIDLDDTDVPPTQ